VKLNDLDLWNEMNSDLSSWLRFKCSDFRFAFLGRFPRISVDYNFFWKQLNSVKIMRILLIHLFIEINDLSIHPARKWCTKLENWIYWTDFYVHLILNFISIGLTWNPFLVFAFALKLFFRYFQTLLLYNMLG
jgi:hypothetical protein